MFVIDVQADIFSMQYANNASIFAIFAAYIAHSMLDCIIHYTLVTLAHNC